MPSSGKAAKTREEKRVKMEHYVTWIRHGMTAGNQKKRYIGSTEEELSDEGRRAVLKYKEDGKYPLFGTLEPWSLYASPMRRCIQTAALIYPGKRPVCEEELRECDFGLFENKNYLEMADFAPYAEWIASNGTLPFPGGESAEEFKARCCGAARRILCRVWKEDIPETVFVVHGGTIMSVMERFSERKKGYYEWSLGNGELYRTCLHNPFTEEERILEPVALGKEKE